MFITSLSSALCIKPRSRFRPRLRMQDNSSLYLLNEDAFDTANAMSDQSLATQFSPAGERSHALTG